MLLINFALGNPPVKMADIMIPSPINLVLMRHNILAETTLLWDGIVILTHFLESAK
jgi:hypothetical protein